MVSADSQATIINNLEVPPPPPDRQILLKVRFASVDRSAMSEFGVALMSTGAFNTPAAISTQQFGGGRVTDIEAGIPAQLGGFSTNFTFQDVLNVFAFRPDLNIGALIKALKSKGMIEILAEPNIIATSGKEASFLVGCEFPVPVVQGSVVAWIGAETEFPLSQAVASGDAFEHRPSERGHCVQDFSTELDLRDLPGEAAEFEFGADDALPTAHLRFYSAALVVPCCRLPGHAPVAADLGNMAIPNGRITRRLQADHCVLWRWYDHIQGLPIPLPQQISCGRSIVGAVSQKARDRGIQLIQEAG